MYTRINDAHAGMYLFVHRVIPLCLYSVTLVCNCYAWSILLLFSDRKKKPLKAFSHSCLYNLLFLLSLLSSLLNNDTDISNTIIHCRSNKSRFIFQRPVFRSGNHNHRCSCSQFHIPGQYHHANCNRRQPRW